MGDGHLPTTEKFVARPVYHRYLRRKNALLTGPPSENEKRDAILVLRDCFPPTFEVDELLLLEAERIFTEATVVELERLRED